MNTTEYRMALDSLRAILALLDKDASLSDIVQGRDAVLARYQPIFSTAEIKHLTQEQFKSFLLFENNRHWSGLNRKGPRACQDIAALREALALLLDDSKPLDQRMSKVADEVPGMGKALITAILLVSYPTKYGVWNNTSEAALKTLKVWPPFDRGATFGARYVAVNQTLLLLAKDLGIDLWTLDALFFRVARPDGPVNPEPQPPIGPPGQEEAQRFGLERHLHEFLRDNWGKMPLGREWTIYAEQGDEEAGYEYPTDIGRIDLLAKHRTKPRWLVVELKRAQTSDETVGQVLRYIAWVRRHLAENAEVVEGLIICHEAEDTLRYAVSEIPNVSVQLYEVSFTLRPDPKSLRRRD
ncbi:MAG TPA: PDDEXK nuclease domain-containing protein [Candidatus Acidoferrum sp.]|nr:PDDEXK nuclease domain-containing protein [Candidatus Acidoferrum sp.]